MAASGKSIDKILKEALCFVWKFHPEIMEFAKSLVAKASLLGNDYYILFRCSIDQNGDCRDKREFCKPLSNQTTFHFVHFKSL